MASIIAPFLAGRRKSWMLGDGSFLKFLQRQHKDGVKVGVIVVDVDTSSTKAELRPLVGFLEVCVGRKWPVWFTRMTLMRAPKIVGEGARAGVGVVGVTHPDLWTAAQGVWRADIRKEYESAFQDTALATVVQREGVTCLAIIGAFYNSCIEASVTDAAEKRIAPTIVTCGPLVMGARRKDWHTNGPGFWWFEEY
jgi:hypothetical protein